jgi:predicted RNA-binding protein with PUA-like domain
MSKGYWMVKQEPDAYPWSRLVTEGRTAWTGVRNFQARNNLRAMKTGDPVLYYHSVTGKEVVGVAEVVREAYPDPSATEGDWSCVDIAPLRPLRTPVTLEAMKADPATRDIPLIRQSRLSVLPLAKAAFDRIVAMGR